MEQSVFRFYRKALVACRIYYQKSLVQADFTEHFSTSVRIDGLGTKRPITNIAIVSL